MGQCLCLDKEDNDQNEKKDSQQGQEIPSTQTQASNDTQAISQSSQNKQDILTPSVEQKVNFRDLYTLLSPPLGSGMFGEVRKCIHKITAQVMAVKIIQKSICSSQEIAMMLNEVEILKKLDHPNIVRIEGLFQDENKIYIVTEYCAGGELFQFIINQHQLTEQQAALIMKQVLSAVSYCHSHSIVHRDMKPENILLLNENDQDLHIKVIDFGCSMAFNPMVKLEQKLGTPYYIAPEVLKKRYDEKCDIWSCGVILYILLSGTPPFNGKSNAELYEKIQKGYYHFDSEAWDNISEEAKHLIGQMLEMDTKKRISAQEALDHVWLQKNSQTTENLPLIKETLNNLKKFENSQNLSNAIYQFIVNQFATSQEKKDLLSVFKQLDLNSDGFLSQEELMIGLKKVMGEEEAEKEVEQIMSLVGKDSIDYSEYVAATINKNKLLSQEALQKTFKAIDRDGSGTITIDELKLMFGNGNVPDKIWEQLIKEFDANNDGEIQFQEFEQIMMKLVF